MKLNPQNPVTLRLFTYYNDTQFDVLQDLVSEFNENAGLEKGIIVDLSTLGSIDELNKKLIESANNLAGSEDFPDIFITYKGILPYLKDKKEVINYKEYFTDKELDEYVENVLNIGMIDKNNKENIYMLPIGLATDVTYINKTDFDDISQKLGISYKDFEEYESLLNASKKYYDYTDALTPAKNDGKSLYASDNLIDIIFAMLNSMGEPMFVEKDGKYIFSYKKETAKKIWDLLYVPIIKGYYAKYGKFASEDMKTGKLISSTSSTAGSVYYPKEIINSDAIDISVMESPKMRGYERVVTQKGGGIFVSDSTPLRNKAAIEFIKWLNSSENNARFTLNTSYIPIKKENSSMEYIKNFSNENSINKKTVEAVQISSGQVVNNQLYIPPIFNNYEYVRDIIKKYFDIEPYAKRRELLEKVKNGGDYDKLVKEYTSNDSFEIMYSSMVEKVGNELK